MKAPDKRKSIVQSSLSAIGFMVLYILLGTILDYAVTQILSEYFIPNCSEDCYFGYFNAIFLVVITLSVVGGAQAGVRTYRRSFEKQ
jgi:hypothetical protein